MSWCCDILTDIRSIRQFEAETKQNTQFSENTKNILFAIIMSQEDIEKYRDLIARLQRNECVPGGTALGGLSELKNFLAFKPAGEAVSAIQDIGFKRIFHCLNVEDKNQLTSTCEVLRICFEKFNVGEIVRNYTGYVMFLLRHEKDCCRRLAVEEVYRTVTTNLELLPLPRYIDVFVAIAQLVLEEDMAIANKSILITSNLPAEAYPKVLDEMKIALEYGVCSKCNAFEVITNISSKSPELLNVAAELGYIDFMMSELQSTVDVLYQMNILELLSRMAITPHGIKYLVEHGALQTIANLMASLKNDPLNGNLLNPGLLKFFGSISHLYPREIFSKYPELLNSLYDTIETGDQNVLPVALDTLGFIGTTIEAKLSLAASGSRYTDILERVCELIRNSVTEIKIRALYCMASLVGFEKDPQAPRDGPIDHRVTLMTREWFRCLSKQPQAMEALYGICKNPFPDIRLAAFSLLDAACQHQWGEELVARTPGFIEYLQDRTVDYTKQAKEAKYDVIKRLSRSAAFDPNTIMKLTAYVEQGPFFSESAMQVAMEEADE